MRALIEASANATDGAPDGPGRVHHRVIADHLRATSFLIADGVLPSNEGRGYVLRRIMRRAMRHAHLLGASDPVMWRLVPALVAQMGAAFPELTRAEPLIEETLRSEEGRFQVTLDRGLRLLDDELARLPDGAALPGAGRLPPLRHLRLPARPDPGRAARARPRPSTRPASTPRWPSRRPRPAPPGPAPARPPTRRSGSTSPSGTARPSSSATTPRPPRARCSPSCVGGQPGRDRGGRHRGPGRAEPDAVLRRVRRPGRRHRQPPHRPRPGRDHRRPQEGRALRPPRPRRGGHARRGAAAELIVDHDRRARDPRQPLGDPPAARGAAPRARRPRRPARQPRRARPPALRLRPPEGDAPGGARGRRGRGQRLRPAEHPRRDPDHDPGRRRDARRPRALRREVRRRGPRRRDGRAPRQRPRPGRRHLLARALRRHPRPRAPATSAPSSWSPRARPRAASAASRR